MDAAAAAATEPGKPTLGAMMAGGNPAEGRKERDWYATPIEASLALLTVEDFSGGLVHECACGDGAMAKVLEHGGLRVVSSDIHPLGYGKTRDYFTIARPVSHFTVTNPPFKLAKQFLLHAMTLNQRKIAFLLKATYFHAKNRVELYEEFPPVRIHPLAWRLDFANLGRPAMECSWFVWEPGFSGEPAYKRPLIKPRVPEALRHLLPPPPIKKAKKAA